MRSSVVPNEVRVERGEGGTAGDGRCRNVSVVDRVAHRRPRGLDEFAEQFPAKICIGDDLDACLFSIFIHDAH